MKRQGCWRNHDVEGDARALDGKTRAEILDLIYIIESKWGNEDMLLNVMHSAPQHEGEAAATLGDAQGIVDGAKARLRNAGIEL